MMTHFQFLLQLQLQLHLYLHLLLYPHLPSHRVKPCGTKASAWVMATNTRIGRLENGSRPMLYLPANYPPSVARGPFVDCVSPRGQVIGGRP